MFSPTVAQPDTKRRLPLSPVHAPNGLADLISTPRTSDTVLIEQSESPVCRPNASARPAQASELVSEEWRASGSPGRQPRHMYVWMPLERPQRTHA